jgi:heat-inducible transcriptional repressor
MKIPSSELNRVPERAQRILHDLIDEYITNGCPVGSQTLAQRGSIDLSAATLRNVMAELEEMGYLFQPHVSAGRIPTEKALRFYVDTILEVRSLTMSEKKMIREKYTYDQMELSDLLKETSQVLSEISKNISVVVMPKFITTVFKLIEFVNLGRDRILVIFVSQSGVVQNRVIAVDEEMPQLELDNYARYLNELLKGLTLQEVKNKILEEMQKEKNSYDLLMSKALALSKKALDSNDEAEVYVEGMLNLLEYPEFAEVKTMKRILHAIEEKQRLLKLLNKALAAKGVQIFIGSENELQDMEGCSLVTAPYAKKNQILGALGVIGPTRMDYERIIPIVDYTAKIVSRMLELT